MGNAGIDDPLAVNASSAASSDTPIQILRDTKGMYPLKKGKTTTQARGIWSRIYGYTEDRLFANPAKLRGENADAFLNNSSFSPLCPEHQEGFNLLLALSSYLSAD